MSLSGLQGAHYTCKHPHAVLQGTRDGEELGHREVLVWVKVLVIGNRLLMEGAADSGYTGLAMSLCPIGDLAGSILG